MSATAEMPTAAKAPAPPSHGVNTPVLLATINAVGAQPELAKFQFRAKSQWVHGTHMRSSIDAYFGAGGEQSRAAPMLADADHPTLLCGDDKGPTPVEWVLHALAACLTAGIANIAAARGVTLTKAEATVEGDIDMRGILGLSGEVRNGFQEIRVAFEVAGKAPPEKLEAIVQQSVARSAVFDMLTNGLPVKVSVKA